MTFILDAGISGQVTNFNENGVADISRSLEGRAAGVSVQNVSGTFGSAPKIRVRGATFPFSLFFSVFLYGIKIASICL